jgi:hypothetical protein
MVGFIKFTKPTIVEGKGGGGKLHQKAHVKVPTPTTHTHSKNT